MFLELKGYLGVSGKWIKSLIGLKKSEKSQSSEKDEKVDIYVFYFSFLLFVLLDIVYLVFIFKVWFPKSRRITLVILCLTESALKSLVE